MQTVKKRGKANQALVIEDAIPNLQEAVLIPKNLPSNLILHLKKSVEMKGAGAFSESEILSYDPTVTTPSAYDPVEISKFDYVGSSVPVSKEAEAEAAADAATRSTDASRSTTTSPSPNEKWCWWCCHSYKTRTLRMPIRKNADATYECIGTFCSPECTCAYIMDSGSRYGERWKQYELLHEMIHVNEKINPAPNRELLKVFGGNLDINDFRSSVEWKLVYPPMVSLKMQMDDTPVENADAGNPMLLNTNCLNIKNFNLDNIEDVLPEKRKKKSKNVNTNGSLDRFWTIED